MIDTCSKRDIRISKVLSYLLRHGALKENLHIDVEGYVKISELLQHPKLKSDKVTLDDIKKIVINNNKQRFNIKDGILICANQGHSIELVKENNLKLLHSSEIPSEVFHGTTKNNLKKILDSGGLCRMKRNHLHLTTNEFQTCSGIRCNSKILIYLDVEKCLRNGIEFYISKNNVILTRGNENGVVPVDCFKKIIDLDLDKK